MPNLSNAPTQRAVGDRYPSRDRLTDATDPTIISARITAPRPAGSPPTELSKPASPTATTGGVPTTQSVSLAEWTTRRSVAQSAVVAADGRLIEATAGLASYLTAGDVDASVIAVSGGDRPLFCHLVLAPLAESIATAIDQCRRGGGTATRVVVLAAPAVQTHPGWRGASRWRVEIVAEPFPGGASDPPHTAVLLRRQPISDVDVESDPAAPATSAMSTPAMSGQRVQEIVNALPPMVASVNRNGVYEFVNEAYAEHYQRTARQIVGCRVQDVLRPDDLRAIGDHLQRGLAGVRHSFETTLRHRGNGRLFHKRLTYVPQFTTDGRGEAVVGSCLVVITDLTEIRRQEHELEVQRKRVTMAMAAASMGSFEYQRDGRTIQLDANSVRILHLAPDAPANAASFFGAVHPEDRLTVDQAFDRAIDRRKAYVSEFRVTDREGQIRWLAGRGQVVAASGDVPARLIGVHWDVTAAKHLESHPRFLAKLQHRLDSFKNTDELMEEACRQIVNYLRVDSCSVVRTDPVAETAKVLSQYCVDGSRWTGNHAMEDLYPPPAIASIRQDGQIAVDRCGGAVNDCGDKANSDGGAPPDYAAILDGGPAASGRNRFSVVCISGQPRQWRADERRLVRELTAVLHLRLQRAWVEDRLAAERKQLAIANGRLETANRKMRALFEQAHYFQVILDRDGCVTEVNDVTLRAFDLKREATVGRPFWQIRPWSDHLPAAPGQQELPVVAEHLTLPLAGQTHRTELSHRDADGRLHQTEFTYTPALDAEGEVSFIVATGSDITARHNQDEAIRIGQQRLRLAFSAAELQLWQIDIASGRWSSGGRPGGGTTVEAMSPRGDIAGFLQRIHRSDRSTVEVALRRSMETGRPFRQEYRVRQGKSFRWMLSVAHRDSAREGCRVASPPGSGMLMVGAEMDITKRKASELDLKLSVERLGAAARTAGFGTFYLDERGDHSVQSVELRDLLGDDAGQPEFVGLQLPYRVHPDDQAAAEAHFVDQVLTTERATPFEHRIVRGNGEVRWVELQTKTSFVHRGGRRRPVAVIGTLLDVTERREVELSLDAARQDAEAANRSKSEFLANMSHEIRTPMTAILGYVDLVAAGDHPEDNGRYLQTIRDNGRFLLTIINDILDLSKIEAGKLEIIPEPIAPHRLVDDVRSIMDVRAREANLRLRVEYDGLIPQRIHTDPKRLKQILINLVSNAIKFSETGVKTGLVTLRVRFNPADSPAMSFVVMDRGIGMTPGQQQRLFKPFTQADASVSRTFGGTGLGLAISKRLAHMLGGNIEVQSEPGAGSTFTVSIDPGDVSDVTLIEPAMAAEATPPIDSLEHRLTGRVLVVDDHRDIRFLTRRILQKAGATVTEAQDGQEAVEQVQAMLNDSHVVDLIILDMQMPRLDGYRTARQLRKMGFAGGIVALTADAMQGDMSKCLKSGCNSYLSKPIDAARLIELAAGFLT